MIQRIAAVVPALIASVGLWIAPARAQVTKSDAITYLPSASSPLVAVRVVFQIGSQDDPKGKEGLAALTSAMVSEGWDPLESTCRHASLSIL